MFERKKILLYRINVQGPYFQAKWWILLQNELEEGTKHLKCEIYILQSLNITSSYRYFSLNYLN